MQGYPWVLGRNEVAAGARLTITTRADAVATETLLPIMYPKFTHMTLPGDTIVIARYLASGAEASSLYLEVRAAPPHMRAGQRVEQRPRWFGALGALPPGARGARGDGTLRPD